MTDYEVAIKKPFTDFKKLIIGIILSFIPVVNWVAKGFALESSGLGRTQPSSRMPEWKNYWKLFKTGLLADIITFIYLLPAFVVLLIGIGLAVVPLVSMFATQISGNFLTSSFLSQNWTAILPVILGVAPVFLLALVLFILGGFFAPMAVMNFVKTKKFGKAFDFSVVKKKSLNWTYFVAWIVVAVVVGIVNLILGFVPLIGAAIAYFITLVFTYTVYGEVYRKVK